MSKKNKTIKKIPEGYFENFESQIKSKIGDLEDKISENAPLLYSIGKDENYLVPENYFENFSLRKKKKTTPVITIMKYSIGIAASFLLLFSVFTQLPNENLTTDLLASVEDDELYDYLILNAESINEELLLDFTDADAYSEEDMNELDFLLENISEIEINDLQDL